VEAIQHQEPGVAVSILRKSGQIGLPAVVIPEKFGGMEMDLTSAMIVAEGVSKDGSYSAWHGAQAGIGALPLLLFGTEDQKQRYLAKVATAEMVAAYCLSEPQAGSDALAAKTRADLSPDGKYYTLNGQKMWITNGGAADLYTIFAKVGGEKFTAFLVERKFPGVQPGAEEKKMGIKGSSTTAVYLDNVKVPVENVLGEIGRGHIIAFNILNLGRLKLGPFAVGGAKEVLRASLKYAKERKAFGKSIAEFGMIQHKLAEMAIRLYATESGSYRVVGLIQGELEGFSWDQPNAAQTMLKAVEEFAAECSYIKVFASEMLDYVVDEGVQIHGGYGFSQEYAVERAYRDSRINRIFEGTNEINRLLATGMLLKRAQRGQLGLVEAVKKLQAEILGGPSVSTASDEDSKLVENAKKAALFALGVAYQKYMAGLEDQQEILAGITDISMNAFAMESALLRTQKLAKNHKGENAKDMTAVFLREAMETIESAARTVLAACSDGDALRTNLAVLKRFTKFEPVDAIATRRRIAARLLQADRYSV
jgi:alkylation response protein AidB-like acyl-CoA dehydrogenase